MEGDIIVIYRTTREIKIEQINNELIIPKGTLIYKIPNDHMNDSRDFNHYSLNGEIFAIEKDSKSIEKVE